MSKRLPRLLEDRSSDLSVKPCVDAAVQTEGSRPWDVLHDVGPTMPVAWTKGESIGSGSFGTVFLGLNSDTGELLAVKEVSLAVEGGKGREAVGQLEQEVALLSALRHPNIVRYVGTLREEARLYIFLEYVPGGSIASLLQRFGPLPEPIIRIYTRQLLSGLAYLHAQRTVHRDVKGANLLVETDGRVKLADFGMAKQIADAVSFTRSFKGSAFWMAPEVIKQQGHGTAADIWSVGCTVLEMATGRPPWSQCTTQVQAIFRIASSPDLPAIPDSLSPEASEFILLCLQRDASARPSAESLLAHPFVSLHSILRAAEGTAVAGTAASGSTMPGGTASGSTLYRLVPALVHEMLAAEGWGSPGGLGPLMFPGGGGGAAGASGPGAGAASRLARKSADLPFTLPGSVAGTNQINRQGADGPTPSSAHGPPGSPQPPPSGQLPATTSPGPPDGGPSAHGTSLSGGAGRRAAGGSPAAAAAAAAAGGDVSAHVLVSPGGRGQAAATGPSAQDKLVRMAAEGLLTDDEVTDTLAALVLGSSLHLNAAGGAGGGAGGRRGAAAAAGAAGGSKDAGAGNEEGQAAVIDFSSQPAAFKVRGLLSLPPLRMLAAAGGQQALPGVHFSALHASAAQQRPGTTSSTISSSSGAGGLHLHPPQHLHPLHHMHNNQQLQGAAVGRYG